jgi:hypothetical protein
MNFPHTNAGLSKAESNQHLFTGTRAILSELKTTIVLPPFLLYHVVRSNQSFF